MSKEINLQKWDKLNDGVLNDENMAKKLLLMGYHCTKYVFSPGTDFPDHTHNMSKMDAITSGKFLISMYGQQVIMEPGDIVEVPKNTVHNAHVVGSDNVTLFDSYQ
uniref:Cupin type-2 domain-containing protein n=1 Tax=Arion vulgaris TaxID=1028688 RepID=A0A0B7A2P4_9EUPU